MLGDLSKQLITLLTELESEVVVRPVMFPSAGGEVVSVRVDEPRWFAPCRIKGAVRHGWSDTDAGNVESKAKW